ncbi:LOW QUALITY PROTEIN: Aspartic protease [Phytophthora megakarya]|uniref:Aspartic protease n=1 Tax=Phytophthora megakarya TaxID=4795 RepID=A0A225UJU9_9STRA|nr:LOW QUALITY PROTEIN: Aspartic protease [Phytophthora megakarya]
MCGLARHVSRKFVSRAGRARVRIQYGHTNPEREVVWAGRGDRWVTKIVYQARSWPVAIKVVNVSKHSV